MDTRTWIRIGLSVLPFIGCIVGSVVGIAYGWLFSELFKALLQSSPPASYGYIDSILASATTNVENWAIAIYSLVFIGLGWTAGFIVGGVAGLFVWRAFWDAGSHRHS